MLSPPPVPLRSRLARIHNRLRGRGFAGDAARLVSGTAFAHALSVAAMPVLAWVYRPDDFAVLGLFVTFVTFASNLAALRYESALVAADSDLDCQLLTVGATVVAAGGSVLAGVVLWLLSSRGVLGYGVLPPAVPWLAAFAIFQTSVYNVLRQWAVRKSQFGLVSRSTVAQGVSRFAAQGGLALAAPSSLSLIAGEIISRFFGVRRLVRNVLREMAPVRSHLTSAAVVERLRAYSHFPKLGLPSTLVNAAALLLPLPLVTAAWGPAAGGAYFLAQRVLGLPALLLGRGVADALLKHVWERRGKPSDDVRRFVSRVVLRLLVVGAVPTGIAAALSPWLIPMLFGPDWELAGWMVAAIAPRSLAALAISPLSQLFALSRSFHRKLIYDAAHLAANALTLPLLAAGGTTAAPAVAIASLAQVAAYGLLLALVLRSIDDVRGAVVREDAPASCRAA